MAADIKPKQLIPHSLIMENRKKLNLTGVSEVDRFDENLILVYTSMGELAIKGKNLHISKLSLDSGEMNVDGEISSLIYTQNESKNSSFFSKLFK